jgi:hypothetical protein
VIDFSNINVYNSNGKILEADCSAFILYKLLGILDEGFAILFVVKKVRDKMTPAIENKVKDTLEEWFGPEYTVSDAKA